MHRPIWLVGMMGSGKTTVGPLVALELGLEFVDTDHVIEEMTGLEIDALFAESEAAFRDLEVTVVRSLSANRGVIATGGGAVTTEAADLMADSGFVVWLRATVPTLLNRVGDGSRRPLLKDGVDALIRLDQERAVSYERVADVVIDTDDLDPDSVARKVVTQWRIASSPA
jgi:shikimate kinase